MWGKPRPHRQAWAVYRFLRIRGHWIGVLPLFSSPRLVRHLRRRTPGSTHGAAEMSLGSVRLMTGIVPWQAVPTFL
jgi:hypothetical protein